MRFYQWFKYRGLNHLMLTIDDETPSSYYGFVYKNGKLIMDSGFSNPEYLDDNVYKEVKFHELDKEIIKRIFNGWRE